MADTSKPSGGKPADAPKPTNDEATIPTPTNGIEPALAEHGDDEPKPYPSQEQADKMKAAQADGAAAYVTRDAKAK